MKIILAALLAAVPVPNFAPYPHFAPLPQFTPAAGTTPGLAHRLDLRRPPAIETPPAPSHPPMLGKEEISVYGLGKLADPANLGAGVFYRMEWRRGRWGRMYQVPIQERQRQPGGSVRSSSREGGADYSSAAVPFTDDPNEVPEKMLRANTRQHTAPKEPRHPAPHGEENPGTSPPHVPQQSGAVCPTCPRGG
jgi:hypothetical protein